MNQAVLTVLIAGLLPIVCAGIAKWGVKDFDNRHPRQWLATLEGRRARANAAQENSFEAFPLFAVGVALALFREADVPWRSVAGSSSSSGWPTSIVMLKTCPRCARFSGCWAWQQ